MSATSDSCRPSEAAAPAVNSAPHEGAESRCDVVQAQFHEIGGTETGLELAERYQLDARLVAIHPARWPRGPLIINGGKAAVVNRPVAARALVCATATYFAGDQWYHCSPAMGEVEVTRDRMRLVAEYFAALLCECLERPVEVESLGRGILRSAEKIPFRTPGRDAEKNETVPWLLADLTAHNRYQPKGQNDGGAQRGSFVLSEELARAYCSANNIEIEENGNAPQIIREALNEGIRQCYTAEIGRGWVRYSKHLGPRRSLRGWLGIASKSVDRSIAAQVYKERNEVRARVAAQDAAENARAAADSAKRLDSLHHQQNAAKK